jgi:hypothetical protein
MLTTSIALEFNASLFPGGDALAVRRSALTSAAPLASMASILTFAQIAEILQKSPALAYTGPLEVQYGGSNLTDGLWISAELRATCADGGNTNQPHGSVTGNKECTQAVNSTTGERKAGWNIVSASLPLGNLNASSITAVRYAFRDDPCCPGIDRSVVPCPPGSCPIQGYNSTLPAVPFVATIKGGKCTWISSSDGQTPA